MPEPSGGGEGASQTPTAGPVEGQVQAPVEPQVHETADTGVEGGGSGGEGLPGVLSTQKETAADKELAKQLGMEPTPDEDEPGERKPQGRERPRGPDGRWMKTEEQVEGERPAPAPGSEGRPEPGAEVFEFAGERWDNREKAEQSFRTLRGMHKSLEARSRENWDAYAAWKSYGEEQAATVQQLQARIAELEQGSGRVQPGSGNGKEAAADVRKVVDWDAYEYILRQGSPQQAGDYLIDQIMAHVNDVVLPTRLGQLKAEMQDVVRPATEQARQAALVQTMTEVTTQLAGYKTPDGRDAFPELKNPAEVERIGYLWAQEARDEADAEARLHMLTTPAGLAQAVAMYRLINSIETPPVAAAPVPPDLPSGPVDPGASAIVETGPSGMPMRRAPGGRVDVEFADLDRGNLIDNDLGFARNPTAYRR